MDLSAGGAESFRGAVTSPRLSRVHPVASRAFGPLDAISCCWRFLSEPPPPHPTPALRAELAHRCVLGLQTQFSGSSEDFAGWHWPSRDPTCPFP